MAYYDTIGSTSENYSVRGGGSGDYPTSTVYNLNFNVGEQNNLIIRGFETGTNVYNYVQLAQRINIVRVNNPTVTGLHNIVFFEEESVASSNVNLKPSLVSTMVNSLRSDLVNRGADNVFANQGDGNGNNNNIERIDYIFNAGFPYFNFTDQRGFLVMDRGGNDRFKIAVITAVDTNGLPAAFSRPVSVLDTNWGPSGITLETTVMRGYTENGAVLRPSARTSVQSLSGVYLSWDQFGLTTNDMVYGYSLAGNDVTTNGAHWLQVTNPAYFPTNTTVESQYGGLDLISGGAMFFDEVLDVGVGDRVWEDWDGDGVQDAGEPGLSNVLVHIYTSNNVLAATARSDADGAYFAQGMGPGTYTLQFFPPDGYQFSPQYARTEPDLDSDPNALSGITDPIVLGSGQTNRSVDAGLYLTPGNLRLSKTVAPTNVNVGDAIVFTLTVTNAGTPSTDLIQVTDVLPTAFAFSGYGASSGTFNSVSGVWDIGRLAAGASARLVVTGQVSAGSGGSRVTNTAAITRMNRPDTNMADNTASAAFRVQAADLAVAKEANRMTMSETDSVVYTIAVTNRGPDAASGIEIDDLLPAGLEFIGATGSQGSYDDGTGVWSVGSLSNGGSATLQITASAMVGSGGLYLTNTATTGASSHEDPELADNSASAVVVVFGADLSITKQVAPAAVSEGQAVMFTLTVTNPGPSEATGVEVLDLMPAGLFYVSHVESQGLYSQGTGMWSIGTLGVNSSAVLQIQAVVGEDTMDTVITNVAQIVATDLPDPVSGNDEAEATVSVSSLTLSKTSDVDVSVHPGDTIRYVVVASNSGGAAHANVSLYDLVPAGATYVPGSLVVTSFPSGPTTVVFTSSSSFSVPAGVTSVTVEAWGGGGGGGRARGNPATGGGGAGGSYAKKDVSVVPLQSYTVTVGTGGIGGNGTGTDTQHGRYGNPSWFGATNTIFAQGGDRGLSDGNINNYNGLAGTGSVVLCVGDTVYRGGHGGRGNFNTASTNRSGAGGGGAGSTGNGGDAATNGVRGTGTSLYGGNGANGVTNGLAGANGVTYGGGGAGGKANSSTDRNGGAGADGLVRITYETHGDVDDPPYLASNWTLAPGQRLEASFDVLVADPLDLMAITNTATATSDRQTVPLTATVVDSVIHADLAIDKQASAAAIQEGQWMQFTLTVTNQSGQEEATGVEVSDLLPDGFDFEDADPSQGSYDSGTGLWAVGSLAPGATATLRMDVTAAVGSGGFQWTNTATITAADQVDTVASNDAASAVVLVEGADLGLTKTVDNATPNETAQVVYTIWLTNSGPSDVTGVAVSEPLTNGLQYVSYSASQGTYSTNTGIWSVGTVMSGNAAFLTLTVQVRTNTFGSTITNQCRVSAANLPDPVSGNNQAQATVVVSGLRVIKRSNVSGYATPGDTITYTITVSNLSSVTHTGIQINDVIPTGTVYVAGSLNLALAPANPMTNVLFTGSSTFATPPGVTSVTVEAWGGGGGGGAALGNPSTGGGGAGGSYARRAVAVVAGQTYPVSVGAGGNGGTTSTTNGQPGSNSWFSTTNTVFAQGGARGMGTTANSNNAAAGAGSSALCVGDVTYRGGSGSTGNYTSVTGYSGAGGGGAGSTGNGGNAVAGTGGSGTSLSGGNGANGATNNMAGAGGSLYGGGGAGGKANSSTDQNGGRGTNGLVRITYSPRGETLAPPTLASNWTLAAGATLTLTFDVTVINPGSVTQLLNVVSVTCDQQPTPVTAWVADRVRHTDLAIFKSVDNVHPNEGDAVTYTLAVSNAGPTNATGILVLEPLTNGLTYVSHLAGQGVYDSMTGVWTVGAIDVGATAELQISATVDAGTAGSVLTNRSWISGADMADLLPADNTAMATVTVVGVDVGLGKAATPGSPAENGLVVYTVSATNFGPDAATGIEVTDILPNGVTYLAHEAGQGDYDSGSGIWSLGNLDPLQVATLSITAIVGTNTAGTAITNSAAVTDVDQVDPNSGNDSALVVVVPGESMLALEKTAIPAGTVWAGDTITYTLAITNRSGLLQTNVVVSDPLPLGAAYVADSCRVNAPVTVEETFGDQFSRRVYSNNDGTRTWTGDWVEGENNGPTAGSIQIQFDNGVDETYTLRFSGGSQNIGRIANLSPYTSAILEFDYQRIGLEAGEYVAIQISTNGLASPWTELARFSGAATDADYVHYRQNISTYISPTTAIRFVSPSGMDSTDILWVDDILITGTRRANQTVAGGIPPNLVSGLVLEPGEAMSIQFAVWVENPALYTQIVNQASLTSAQMPDPQVDTAVTPVEACFTAAPTGLYADPTNATRFTARWNVVSGAFGYRLDVATDPAFAANDYVGIYSNLFVAGQFQAVTGLVHDTLYYFRVRAEWSTLCTSSNSATVAVTTRGLPTIEVFPEQLDFGVVDVNVSSNLIITVTNSGTESLDISLIEFTGPNAAFFSVLPATASIGPGNSVDLTVTYAPTEGGNDDVIMTLYNNSPDYPELGVRMLGECFDPAAQPPELLAYLVMDSAGLTNEVTDRSLGGGAATARFTAYHFMGMRMEGAYFDLIYPDGTLAFTNAPFETMETVILDGRDCQKYAANIPHFFPAVLGVYTVRVTVASSNGIWLTEEARFTSVQAGTAVPTILDNFSRTDASDNIGEGWSAYLTGPVPGNVQVRNRVLQLYGPGGTGGTNGRISVVRDLSSRYDPVLTNNIGTMTWAFNFYSGRSNQAGFAPGAYGAAFVLGSDSTGWVGGDGNGYAVRICSNQVALAAFSGGLNLDTDLVTLGTPAALASATSSVSVLVELEAETGVWSLYVRPLSGSGIGAFINPVVNMGTCLVTRATNTLHLYRSLPYVGCYWNHGNAAVNTNAAAYFDDLYAPDVLQTNETMRFTAIDNDIMLPTSLGAVRVNKMAVPEEVPDRLDVVWTNAPEFIVTFDVLASDQDPGYSIPTVQRDVQGIGEYRVSPDPVNVLSASNRGMRGFPFPVVTTNGALANYGFEMVTDGGDWKTNNKCFYHAKAADPELVFEGTNSLRQTAGGQAWQIFEFRNEAGAVPEVNMSGWYRGGSAKVTIDAFSTNDLAVPVDSIARELSAATDWTAIALPEEALGDDSIEVLKVTLEAVGGATYWDQLRLSIDTGTNRPSMRFLAGPENQGLIPQYIYAVDADYNRVGDRLAGLTKYFYIPFDMTPPNPVPMPEAGNGASTETVDDPTTQFDLQWSNVGIGPDDPASPVHPTRQPGDIDILSRWNSYKIFYSTYNPENVPLDDDPSSTNGYIYRTFLANGAYRTWNQVGPDTPIEDPSAPGYQENYRAMTNFGTTSIRLYDLEYDQDYAVVVVSVDKAGNVGNAGVQSWATNNTIRFALIRGELMDKDAAQMAFPTARLVNSNTPTAAALYWVASGPTNEQGVYTEVKKDYDLISWDSTRFQESSNNNWQLIDTVRTNWFVDDAGQMRSRGQLHFYRASYKDRWRRTNVLGQVQRRLASEEVFAMHNVVLSSGPNFVALHGVPYTNTFRAVFGGTETFPGGASALPDSGSTVVEFFEPGTNALSSEQYFLSNQGDWIQVGGDVVTDVLQPSNFFCRGFSITLPSPLPDAYTNASAVDEELGVALSAMVWSPILKVPTNGFEQVIQTGSRTGRTTITVYNLVALTLPVCVHPSEMRLLESGFVNGTRSSSDQIYTLDTTTKTVRQGSTIYCDPNGVWRFMTNDGLVPAGYFAPNDVIVLVSRNGSGVPWTWRYDPRHFYSLPTRNMSP